MLQISSCTLYYSPVLQESPKEMEVDVEQSPTSSPVKQNGMVVEVAGPCVIQYKDKKNREKVYLYTSYRTVFMTALVRHHLLHVMFHQLYMVNGRCSHRYINFSTFNCFRG